MLTKEFIFQLIGGLGLFFFGMRALSEGLKRIAGERLRKMLEAVTKVPIVGIMIGAAVTCLIQSSSATTVMVVGFVNAGLLALKQAISVIIGANIGTTFTAWLVSSMSVFKVTQYALPAIGIGFFMMALARNKKRKSWGEVIFGFGILFLGLSFMKDAFDPFRSSEQLKDIFVLFSDNPLLGVLVGTIITILLQSSSATIAIVQVLAFNGLISFESAVPLILGDNIGTTITAQMAAIGANLNARRAAMSHSLFNVIGVAYMLFFVYSGIYVRFINYIIPGELTLKNIMFYIAVSHSFFNVMNALVFLPLIGSLAKISTWMIPKRKGTIEPGTQYLEKHLLETPPVAMQQARREIIYMLSVASKAIRTAVDAFIKVDNRKIHDKVIDYERITDNLQSEITQYLIELSQRELSEEESREIPVLIHNVNDIERIGDHSENIAALAQTRLEEKLNFTADTMEELKIIWSEVDSMLEETEKALRDSSTEIAQKILEREGRVNGLENKFKQTHIERLNRRICHLNSNFIFLDFIDNLEKIADHLTNIAQGIIGKMQWSTYKQGESNV